MYSYRELINTKERTYNTMKHRKITRNRQPVCEAKKKKKNIHFENRVCYFII